MAEPLKRLVDFFVELFGSRTVFAFVLYSIGVIFLFYVFRRSIARRRKVDRRDDQCLRTRSLTAHAKIDQIAGRQWVEKYRGAVKFARHGEPLPPEQRRFLAAVSAHQQAHLSPSHHAEGSQPPTESP
jgi:hypothetical protein